MNENEPVPRIDEQMLEEVCKILGRAETNGDSFMLTTGRIVTFITAWNTRQDPLRKAAAELVAALDRCQPHIDNAFVFYASLGGCYSGPKYVKELEALREALAPPVKDESLRNLQQGTRNTGGNER